MEQFYMPLKTAQCYILSNTSQYQLYTIKPRTDLYAIKDITLLNTSQHYTPLNTSQCYAPLNIGEFYTLLNTAQCYNTQQNTIYETVLRIWGERFDDSFTTCTFFICVLKVEISLCKPMSPIFLKARISPQWLSQLRQLWRSVFWWVTCELIFPDRFLHYAWTA